MTAVRANFENALRGAVAAALRDGLELDLVIECLENQAIDADPRMLELYQIFGIRPSE